MGRAITRSLTVLSLAAACGALTANAADEVRRSVEVHRLETPTADRVGLEVPKTPTLVVKDTFVAGGGNQVTIQVVGANEEPVRIDGLQPGDLVEFSLGDGRTGTVRRADGGVAVDLGDKVLTIPLHEDGTIRLDRDFEDLGVDRVAEYEQAKVLMDRGYLPRTLAEDYAGRIRGVIEAAEGDPAADTVAGGSLGTDPHVLVATYLERPNVQWTRSFGQLQALQGADDMTREATVVALCKLFDVPVPTVAFAPRPELRTPDRRR